MMKFKFGDFMSRSKSEQKPIYERTIATCEMPEEPQKEFKSSDFYLSAFLKAKGIELIGKEPKGNGKRFNFVFRYEPDIEGMVRDYFNGGMVRIDAYVKAQNELKALLYGV